MAAAWPDPPARPVVFRRNHYETGIFAPALLLVGSIVFLLVRDGTLDTVVGVLGLVMAAFNLWMFPWRVLVFDDEVEIRYVLRKLRRVARSEVTVVAQGKLRGGVLMFVGPNRRPSDMVGLTGLFAKRSAAVVQTLARHGYTVSTEMPSRR